MSSTKALVTTAAASLALLAFAKAAFVRQEPSIHAQDMSRGWFALAILLICAALFVLTTKRSRR